MFIYANSEPSNKLKKTILFTEEKKTVRYLGTKIFWEMKLSTLKNYNFEDYTYVWKYIVLD